MYQDQESIKVFEKVHARDSMRELARHVGESSSDSLDVFGAHARTENQEGQIGTWFSIAIVAILIGTAAFFWK